MENIKINRFSIRKASALIILSVSIALLVNFFLEMIIVYNGLPNLDYRMTQPLLNNNSITNNYITYVILILIALISSASFFVSRIAGIVLTSAIVITGITTFITTDVSTERQKIMTERYELIIKETPLYSNTENARKLREAIKNKQPEVFVNILKDTESNTSSDVKKVIALLKIILEITPELKDKMILALSDEFLSVKEYNDIRVDILEIVTKSKLDSNQVALLAEIRN